MRRFSKLFLFLSPFFILFFGFYVSNGFCESSFGDLRKSAESGNAEAQLMLGLAYGDGKGVTKNTDEAVKWYRKSAEQGNARAQLMLGAAYYWGVGTPKNMADAVKWYRKSAEQGLAKSQYILGILYDSGEGVPKNLVEAVKWYRKAAEQGDVEAQLSLGNAYALGEGVPKDDIEALAWLKIAAATGSQEAAKNCRILEQQIGISARKLLAEQRTEEILKKIESSKQTRAKSEETGQKQLKTPDGPKGSGTGIFLTNDGLILTAAHVVRDSTMIKVGTHQGLKTAWVVKLDNFNDLALLKCEGIFQSAPVKSSSGIKLGQSVFTIGFPNIEFQGFSPKMTKGEINSLSGLQDDPRHWQISVPVQPGNSGGPLFDEAGNVVGVVLSKLDAIKVAKFTGDLPQNVNYALKSIYALPLLEPFGANLAPESRVSSSPNKLEDVVERVQGAVVLIIVY
jgi:uncharacterized protein